MSRGLAMRRRAREAIVEPLQEFLRAESAGGIVLLAAAVLALVWANSPASGAYSALWEAELTLGTGSLAPSHDLRGWVNDGLMVLFFFVIGLEIKRELVTGELRRPRVAALPALAAVGGVVLPAVIFFGIVGTGEGAAGWGIPGGHRHAEAAGSRLAWGVAVGLVVGKTLGIGLVTLLAHRTRVASLPPGVGAGQVWGVAALAGIGFTVSLFITELAYTDPALIDSAKVGIFAGSTIGAALGVTLLLRAARRSLEAAR